ncbi:MAG: ABC transporter ATP-binding protein [Alistipes sp.]|nr:ABC transporter ATP-binding protein [Alistipes sp.]MBQ6583543.1 ABC transporter ATP-binding protein [Alistipes sp.]
MIQVNELTFSYPQKSNLFDNLSLRLPAGEIIGLLGRNGVGKSTLIKLLSSLLTPQQGVICFQGKAITRGAELYSRLMVVPEEFTLPKVTVKSFVQHTAPLYPAFNQEQFDHYCNVLEVDCSAKFSDLSMGQRKKAYLAFALACNVELLLLDEPTNGLDITAKAALRSILAAYADESKTIIISTHQAHDIENLVDRVVILEGGNVLINQSVAELQQLFGFGIVTGHKALYSQQSVAGQVGIWRADSDEEGRFDLELMFNAAIKATGEVCSVIAQKLG